MHQWKNKTKTFNKSNDKFYMQYSLLVIIIQLVKKLQNTRLLIMMRSTHLHTHNSLKCYNTIARIF